MELIESKIFEALGYLFVAAIVYFAWETAYKETVKGGFWKIFFKGLLWCVGIAFFASISLGDPTCINFDQDIRGETCYEYADDGYEPTSKQRAAQFAYYMTLLYVPVVLGAFKGRKELMQQAK